jgi:acyl-CoA synthetase (AMP-forming)/AMP-acid ligase II
MSTDTVWTRWCRQADRQPDAEAVVVVRAGEPPVRWTRAAYIRAARQYAAWLAEAGVGSGQTCAIISRHHPNLCIVYAAVSALGAIPAVLAYPNARLHPDKFREGLLGISKHSGLDWILTERDLEATLMPLIAGEGSTVRGLIFPYEAELTHEYSAQAVVRSEAPALLQHSSGTTGLQKAVALSHRCVLDHVTCYGAAIEADGQDRVVSWLPLYHDMGLIAAFHLPLALGIPTVQLDPIEWVMAPVLLIETLFQERGTLSWLPNFAFSLMGARLRDEDLEGCSLAHVRMLINCSELVQHASNELFYTRLQRFGLRRTSLASSYAMAEATFAVTQTRSGEGCPSLELSRPALRIGVVRPPEPGEQSLVCASSGRALNGCDMRVMDDAGHDLDDDRVGELLVRTPSLFDGYRNQPSKTAAAMRDGWYLTGDLGFRHGELWFVVGRKKDMIVIAGKNLYPEDIEAVVSTVPGAVPGRAVAFGMVDSALGTERVHVIVETHLSAEERPRLRDAVIASVQDIDVTVTEVHCVDARWLIKSSSGKPSRTANRDRLFAELAKGMRP